MGSYSTLLLPILEEVILNEIGEANIEPLDWSQTSSNSYKFLMDIGDFTEVVEVDFEKATDEASKQYYLPPKYQGVDVFYNVAYMVSGDENQYAKTTIKVLLKILSTVVAIVEDFISKNSPKVLMVAASEKNIGKGDNLQKLDLYKAYIRKSLEKNTKYSTMLSKGGILVIDKNL